MDTKTTDGFSARRKTIYHFTARTFILTAGLIFFSCHDKSAGQPTTSEVNPRNAMESLDKPKVNVKVNRHYDDKGRMIGMDSTYSAFYSNVEGDSQKMDSLMNRFDLFFNNQHASSLDANFNALFFDDSLRHPDFFHDDFFMKRYELNDIYMRDMMNRMDSIKNKFYREEGRLSRSRKKAAPPRKN